MSPGLRNPETHMYVDKTLFAQIMGLDAMYPVTSFFR